MILLAIETSCDETSAAVIRDGRVLSNVVASQIQMHAEYGGVVPELATREHLRNVLPVARQALTAAGVAMNELQAVAATQGPGLPGALLVGFQAAQTAAFSLGIPFLGIHHHEAHLYSPWITGDPLRADFEDFQPNVSLIVSGGHTLLVHVRDELVHEVIGSTIDDAAGECFDKVAKLMGLPYPGGPQIERLAVGADPKAHAFPRPMLHDSSDDFSFSGLKTAVRYFLRDHAWAMASREGVAAVCASVQAAIIEVLVAKTVRAAKRRGVRCVTASGGVSCNRAFQAELARACAAEGLALRVAARSLCTDNAAMIGVLAERKLLRGASPAGLDAGIRLGWDLNVAGSPKVGDFR